MHTLRELARIISDHKAMSLQDFGNQSITSTKLYKLYKGILENKFSNDKEAAEYLFPKAKTGSQYNRLKDKLKRKLINKSFFIDTNTPRFNDYQRAHQECYKDWASIKILLAREGRNAGIELAKKLFRQAQKFEFTDILLDISRILRRHYGAVESNPKKYQFYKEAAQHYIALQEAEFELEEFYEDLILQYTNNKTQMVSLYQTAQKKISDFTALTQKYNSYKLQYYYHLIMIIQYMSVNDYEKTITICNSGIRFIESKPFQTKTSKATFLYQQLACYTQLRKYKEGKNVAEICVQLKAPGTYNWFKALELYLILCLHTKEYQTAIEVFNIARNNNRFKFLNKNSKEIWQLFEAYLHYLIKIKKVELISEEKSRLQRFRLGKFLNEVPAFSKDKYRMNIPILIFQIVYKLSIQDYDNIIERTEAIEKYCSRYLKKDNSFRSNCFIKMLLTIPKSSFHKIAVLRHSKKFHNQLLSVPLELSRQAYEVEIIPYEDLWEYVLESMDKQFH